MNFQDRQLMLNGKVTKRISSAINCGAPISGSLLGRTRSGNGTMRSFGELNYCPANNGRGSYLDRMLRIRLVEEEDGQVLKNKGLIFLRRQRICRITNEAEKQGYRLTYPDLAVLLLTSLSTLKRDIAFLRKNGLRIPLATRRKKRRVDLDVASDG